MSEEEAAIRMATVLSTVMNVAAILHNEPVLTASDPSELRSTLLWIVDELSWLESVVAGGATAGISWPSNGKERIERLRAAASAWAPVGSPPPEVREAARNCIAMVQPGA
jgi:hypothetical protein